MKWRLGKRGLSSARIITFGFLGVILLGTLLLMLPFSTKGEGGAPFLDALFTATSATCVTGLVVHDTATYWSTFGHIVILTMIQIGGMGVITIAVLVAKFSGKHIGLMQRSLMQESISAPQVGGIVRLTVFVFKATAVIELTGAVLMAPVFIGEFKAGKGIWYSIFHSVSAFCNAGFDLMGVVEPGSSLTTLYGNPIINIVIMLLIIVGGIGFLTWDDIRKQRWHIRKYRMQSKVVLTVSGILIILPAVYFFFCEFSGEQWNWMSGEDRFWASMFQSVTARTAGFNTVDLAQLSGSGQLLMIVLMLIGGSPGSTAGGMKTTTAAVLLGTTIAVFRKKEEPQLFGRRVELNVVATAATILSLYLTLSVAGGIVISTIEEIPIITALFETASAIGTVGVTLGITAQLGVVSRMILIVLMFFGRAGVLTIVFAAISRNPSHLSKLPAEKITVG